MLRPIDLALNIGHAQEMRQGAESQNTRPELAMQQFADRLEKQVRESKEQVQRQDATQKNNINKDREGHGKGYKPKPKQKKHEAKKSNAVLKESMFDILV